MYCLPFVKLGMTNSSSAGTAEGRQFFGIANSLLGKNQNGNAAAASAAATSNATNQFFGVANLYFGRQRQQRPSACIETCPTCPTLPVLEPASHTVTATSNNNKKDPVSGINCTV